MIKENEEALKTKDNNLFGEKFEANVKKQNQIKVRIKGFISTANY